MLQRMVEDFIYSDILAKAASCDTTLEELTYVAAFATSCYAANRVNKPFNPMLGETYECDRRAELGWRCFMEQVRKPQEGDVMCEGGVCVRVVCVCVWGGRKREDGDRRFCEGMRSMYQ